MIFTAASVIVLRKPFDVLLMQRPSTSSFMPSAYVFPGGKLDPVDFQSSVDLNYAQKIQTFPQHVFNSAEAYAVWFTALRELFEETGVVLRLEDLHYWAHWLTPSLEKKRFDTHFFISVLEEQTPSCPSPLQGEGTTNGILSYSQENKTSPSHSSAFQNEANTNGTLPYSQENKTSPSPPSIFQGNGEVADVCFMSISDALSSDILLPPPTLFLLRELQLLGSIEKVLEHFAERTVVDILPKIILDPLTVLLPWDRAYSSIEGESYDASILNAPSRFVFRSQRWGF